MMKAVALLALVAATSAQLTSFSYPYGAGYSFPYAAGAYSYGAYPYGGYSYGAYPYGAYPYSYAPIAKSFVAPGPAYIAPAHVKTQYHAQDTLSGSAAYGHFEHGQAHEAIQDAAGNKAGSFSHVLPDGTVSRTDYVADSLGYRVASNSLPINVAPLPLPVSDTPEVAAARAEHLAEVEKVKSRSKRAIAYTGAYSAPLAYTHAAYTAPVAAYSSAYTPSYYTNSAYYNAPLVSSYAQYPHYY